MTNGPKDAPKRQWNTDGLYNKPKFRSHAEKRSRVEGTPDADALEFVGVGPPNRVKSRSDGPADNPYGRREAGTRRMQEVGVNEYARRESMDEISALKEWEVNKVPLVCPQWRLSNNCPYSAQICKFMHRNHDGNGRSLKIGDESGFVPQKYRNPPVTCSFWLQKKTGCMKSDTDCDFAHYDTGLLPQSKGNAQPVRSDSNAQPASEQIENRPPMTRNTIRPKKNNNLDLTCKYWARGFCKKPDEVCEFKHYHTGVIANGSAKNTICMYFQSGHCRFTGSECKFLHLGEGINPAHADTNNYGTSLVNA
jgi:chromo domain-containing protein 1